MSDNPLEIFKYGARTLRTLRSLGPGQRYRLTYDELDDCHFPADPLTWQDHEFKLDFLRGRMPFPVTVTHNLEQRAYDWDRK